jgi:hypothetical protein
MRSSALHSDRKSVEQVGVSVQCSSCDRPTTALATETICVTAFVFPELSEEAIVFISEVSAALLVLVTLTVKCSLLEAATLSYTVTTVRPDCSTEQRLRAT